MKSLLGDSETDRDKPVFGGSCCRLRLLLPGWHVLTTMKFRSDSLPRRAAVPPNLSFIHTPELISTWLIILREEGKRGRYAWVEVGVRKRIRKRERGRAKKERLWTRKEYKEGKMYRGRERERI